MRPPYWLYTVPLRLRSLFRKPAVEEELDEELRYHIDKQAEQHLSKGVAPEEARYAALREFGSVEQRKEECRDARGVRIVEELLQDARYGVRLLRKSPGFTVAAILTLALGIGGTTAVFSLLDQVVLRPLPVKHPEELVLLSHDGPYGGSNRGTGSFSNPMYRDLSRRNEVLAGLAASYHDDVSLTRGGYTERVTAMLVSGNYFGVLGATTVLGRPIIPQDDVRPGGHPVVVLSHGYWQRRFSGDPHILDQKVLINGNPMTVIGVAPRGFHGAYVGRSFDVMTPIMMKAQVTPSWDDLNRRRSLWLSLVGRLKPGVTIKQAEASLVVLYQNILGEEVTQDPQLPADQRRLFVSHRLSLEPGATGRSNLRTAFKTPLVVLMIMVGLVLLIACANLANLLIARAAVRQREVAMRLALGAGRWRIARQILTESLILSMSGGALGLLLATWSLRAMVGFLPSDQGAQALNTSVDTRVLAFTFAISVLTGLVFGLLPAFRSTNIGLAEVIKGQATSAAGAISAPRLRQALVVTQVALSLLLLIGCGLFTRSLYNLASENPGFPVERLVTFSVDARSSGYSFAEAVAIYRRLQEQFARLPGLRAVSMSVTPPLRDARSGISANFEGYRPGGYPYSYVDYTGPGFFATMGVAVVAGREFTDRDFGGTRPVAMINESAAKRYFEGRNPIGQHIYFYIGPKAVQETEIVGVAKDVKYHTLRDKPEPFTYRPLDADPWLGAVVFCARTQRDPGVVAGPLRRALQDVDPRLTLYDAKTLEQSIGEMLYIDRLLAWLSSAFGLLATLLAAIGVYGVLAYNVTRRTREFGIRLAMGASSASVSWLVLREVAILMALGAVLAFPASYALSRFVQSRLFGVSRNEPFLVMAATLFLVLVGLAAGSIPALRAARVQPMQALRSE